jgi:hypothetical protein
MSKIATVVEAIKGTAYIEAPLQDYHAARAVMNAMRRSGDERKLSGVREALNKYRVSAWLEDFGNERRVVLRRDSRTVLTL